MARLDHNYRVRVYKENFDFSAAHFITLGGRCETLHGHNYRVEVSLSGRNGSDQFLYNFSDLKPLVREECKALDHRVLLAKANQLLTFHYAEISVAAEAQTEIPTKVQTEVEVRFGTRRYVFPLDEVVLLPVENTTAEALATYLLGRLRERLMAQNRPEWANLTAIEVGVEEQPGQMAYFSQTL